MDGREYCIVSDGREYCCFCLFLMAENPVLSLLMAKNTVLLFSDGREYCIVVFVCFWQQRILYCCFCLFLMAENTVLLFLFVFDGREYCIVVSVCFWWQRILYCCFCLFLLAASCPWTGLWKCTIHPISSHHSTRLAILLWLCLLSVVTTPTHPCTSLACLNARATAKPFVWQQNGFIP